MKYLSPRADLTFKRVFGEHPDLVMSLLNALLPLEPGQEITGIEYLSPEMVPETPLNKNSIVDVRCKDTAGRHFLVEMQMLWSPEFKRRVLFNASKAYVRQLDAGYNFKLLQPVYSLNLVNEVFEPDLEGFYHHYQMVHVENSDKVIDGLQLVFVELPKFVPHSYSEKKMQVLWLRYLTEIDERTREVPPELMENPEIRKAVNILEKSAFTPAQLDGYEKFWDAVAVERSIREAAEEKGLEIGIEKGMKKGMEEGIQKGIEKGIEEGIQKGIKQGIEQGIEKGELQRACEIARNLKAMGCDLEFIVKATSLSPQEIEALLSK